MALDLSALPSPRLFRRRHPAAAAVPARADTELHLARGATIALALAPGTRVSVSAGRVWLTERHDLDDHFIAAGANHVVRHGGRIVIEGDSATVARLSLQRG
jgi:hypothetical protein